MNRKLMLVGAIALAGMVALSAPASAAVEDLIITGGDGHLVVMVLDDAADLADITSIDAYEHVVRDFVEPSFVNFAVVEALERTEPVSMNCSTGPAWVAVAGTDGSHIVERLPACRNDFHFGSGSIVADLPASGEGDDEPIAAFCSVAPRLLDGDPMRIDDPGWCLT